MPPSPPGFYLFRFIDVGLITHPTSAADIVFTVLRHTYPANLTFSFDRHASRTNIPFMDLLGLSVAPLRTPVFFKASHTCTYIPRQANVPRHIRTAWVRGECVRYLRLCSAESYFELCCARLFQPLLYWGYPANVWQPPPLRWTDRHRFLVLKPEIRARGPCMPFVCISTTTFWCPSLGLLILSIRDCPT